LALLVAANTADFALWVLAWGFFGRDALAGRLDSGRLIALALMIATSIPCRLFTTWMQGQVAIRAGGLLRQRLLFGALQLSPDEVRRDGAGSFLGRAIEAGAVETLAVSGGVRSVLALIELAISLIVLLAGAAPWLHVGLLLTFAAAICVMAWRYLIARERWTEARVSLTHRLVENMTGHRTRLAQESPDSFHRGEDSAVSRCDSQAQAMDRAVARLSGLVPRLWLIAGLATLAPDFLSPQPQGAQLAISLGGLLLAWRAFRRLTGGVAELAGVGIAWGEISLLFHAAGRVQNPGAPLTDGSPKSGEVIEAHGISFRYDGAERPVIDNVDLRISKGDCLLIEGESGGGKSTLASVLAGIRDPQCGSILAAGLDRKALGERRWRRRIVMAPRYHDNHVLTGPFAYNLLMGRQWPPTRELMHEAQTICYELGLGTLLEQMPAGMMQMVGETGWQLSQGECSRLFLARALLQDASLVILDESFAALAPETLRQSLGCALRRAHSLIVIAHP
jgi:ATP-binding cassette, subfamily B, bacterial